MASQVQVLRAAFDLVANEERDRDGARIEASQ
jgi:hypothetical protein